MAEYERVKISDEEIGRMLDERPGGRKAGRGDSPYTQEEYERLYGLGSDERPDVNDVPDNYGVFVIRDWILDGIAEDGFYDFNWWAHYAESKMRSLVKKYSLARELYISAYENVLLSIYFGKDLKQYKKRIDAIVYQWMEELIGIDYDRESIERKDLSFTEKDGRKYVGQAVRRFNNLLKSLRGLDDGSDELYVERCLTRNLAFELSYLCMRTDQPEETFRLICGMMDVIDAQVRPGCEELMSRRE